MRNVVTPLSRKHNRTAEHTKTHPRHRRDGYFDEQDQWHDSTETTEPASQHSGS
jgi:hypothetical protein